MSNRRQILLTGASGYIGGRLIEPLARKNADVRCLARTPRWVESRTPEGMDVVQGDVLDPETLGPAMEGVDTAYYLIHSMGSADDFEKRDRQAALNFGEAARKAGVGRIVYLGGLAHGDDLSPHLRSRLEVGRILRASGVPTVEFQASIIIGSGSLSFEMIRALVERLPVMITPRWVRTPTQPIAVDDVVAYLLAALDTPEGTNRAYEIAGPDKVSYGRLMQEYARQRGLKRIMIPVPVLSPRLSSLWLGLVTPLFARIGKKLVEGLKNPTTRRDESALADFAIRPRGVSDAIREALEQEERDFVETRWSDSVSALGAKETGWGGARLESRIVDTRTVEIDAAPADAFTPIRRIGGEVGWYQSDWLWQLRGFLDLFFGGAGVRRGRRDPEQLREGDALDFWRVERVEADRLLRLQAEMKVPGRAWLQFEVEPLDPKPDGGTRSQIRQTAIFDPAGLLGLLYWYALYPLHGVIFRGMLRRIGQRAEAYSARSATVGSTVTARRAGSKQATNATRGSRAATDAKTPGSQGLTP